MADMTRYGVLAGVFVVSAAILFCVVQWIAGRTRSQSNGGSQSNEAYLELVAHTSALLPNLDRRLNLMLRATTGQPHRWDMTGGGHNMFFPNGELSSSDRIEVFFSACGDSDSPTHDNSCPDCLVVHVGGQLVNDRLDANTIRLLTELQQLRRREMAVAHRF